MNKECKNCIWFDKCGCDIACDYYDPADLLEIDEINRKEYWDDLTERYKYYEKQIIEQDS